MAAPIRRTLERYAVRADGFVGVALIAGLILVALAAGWVGLVLALLVCALVLPVSIVGSVLAVAGMIFYGQVVFCERLYALMAGRTLTDADKTEMARTGIRALVFVMLAVSLTLALALPPPKKLPGFVLESVALLRVGVFAVTFLGGILILTPVYRGVILGTLPVEISPQGARYEDAAASVARGEERLDTLEKDLRDETALGNQTAEEVEDLAVAMLALEDRLAAIEDRLSKVGIP